MPKIESFPVVSPADDDKIVITQSSGTPQNVTKNITVLDLKNQIQTTGVTQNYIPVSDGIKFVDSILFQDASTGATKVTIGGLISQTSIGESVYVGEDSGANDLFIHGKNVGLGAFALQQFTDGINPVSAAGEDGVNIAIGHKALQATTQGTNNIAIGGQSLDKNILGFNNVAISKNALGDGDTSNLTSNNTSIGIGFSAGNPSVLDPGTITGHEGGVYVGHQALADGIFNTTPKKNVVIGFRALRNFGNATDLPELEENIVIGSTAALDLEAPLPLSSPLVLKKNIIIGRNAGASIVTSDAQQNIILGDGGNPNNKKYVGSNNIVFENSTNPSNTYGHDTTNGVTSPVSENFVVGSGNVIQGNKNIILGPSKTSDNVVGAVDPDDPNSGEHYVENLLLGGASTSISSNIISTTNISNIAKSNTVINSSNTFVTSNYDQNNNITGNSSKHLVINSSNTSLTSAGADNESNVIINGTGVTMNTSFDNPTNNNFVVNSKSTANWSNCQYNYLFGGDVTTNNMGSAKENIVGPNNATLLRVENSLALGQSGIQIQDAKGVLALGNNTTINGQQGVPVQRSIVTGSGVSIEPAPGTLANNAFFGGNQVELKDPYNATNTIAYGSNLEVAGNNAAVFGKNNVALGNGQSSTVFQVGCGDGVNNRANAINIVDKNQAQGNAIIFMDQLVDQNYADDVAAAAAGITVGGLYHTNGVLKINITP